MQILQEAKMYTNTRWRTK